jgi:hypothetical protein
MCIRIAIHREYACLYPRMKHKELNQYNIMVEMSQTPIVAARERAHAGDRRCVRPSACAGDTALELFGNRARRRLRLSKHNNQHRIFSR